MCGQCCAGHGNGTETPFTSSGRSWDGKSVHTRFWASRVVCFTAAAAAGRVEEKRPARLPPSRASRPSSLSSLFVLNVRRCDRCTCALCRLRTRNRSGAFLYGAPRAILHLRREHMSRLPSAPPSTSPPPSSPLPRASLPRDCPILRPRAGLLLSRACDSPFAMSFGATYAHASPLILAARCVVAAACLRRDMSSALQACSRLCAHISMLPNLACSLILTL